jgi:hypothetical protein
VNGGTNGLEQDAIRSLMSFPTSTRERATDAAITARSCSQRSVLPSMTVKRKVAVPLGNSGMPRSPATLGLNSAWIYPTQFFAGEPLGASRLEHRLDDQIEG